jgi:hypothetical protein
VADLTVTVEGEAVRVGDVVFSVGEARRFSERLSRAANDADYAKWMREGNERRAAERASMIAAGWVDGPYPRWLWKIVPGACIDWHDTYGMNTGPGHLPPGIRVRAYGGRVGHVTQAKGQMCACGEYLGSGRVLADDDTIKMCKAHR